jgi:hypothetical protein
MERDLGDEYGWKQVSINTSVFKSISVNSLVPSTQVEDVFFVEKSND